jgi:signal transduction histidine kinase
VGNANKFTKNGSISVSSQQTGGKTILCIADTGVGMTDEQAEALLKNNIDAAVRSTPGTDLEKGNGLGLLLVKEFIDRIDGTITVESSLNSGTTFKIVLQNG